MTVGRAVKLSLRERDLASFAVWPAAFRVDDCHPVHAFGNVVEDGLGRAVIVEYARYFSYKRVT